MRRRVRDLYQLHRYQQVSKTWLIWNRSFVTRSGGSFTPVDRDEAITALLGLRMLYPTVLAETYEKLQSDLRMAEELLAEQVEEILSGARKEKMSTSWHTDVRMAVSLALERRGYGTCAIRDALLALF